MRYNRIITVLGWEDRFNLGLDQEIENNGTDVISLIMYEGNERKTSLNLEKFNVLCTRNNITVNNVPVMYSDPIQSWNRIKVHIEDEVKNGEIVLVNISTMPRDMAWTVLFFLYRKEEIRVEYVYHAPITYGKWLCKEPGKPRLLLNHSGISSFGKETALLILTGYDSDRTQQLIACFEPKLVVLGVQIGEQFDNDDRNTIQDHLAACEENQAEARVFRLNAYDDDCGYLEIKRQVGKLKAYNVIASSLGPKLTTISLYKVWQEHQEIALSYVPTKEYNDKYSTGFSHTKRGLIQDTVPVDIY